MLVAMRWWGQVEWWANMQGGVMQVGDGVLFLQGGRRVEACG